MTPLVVASEVERGGGYFIHGPARTAAGMGCCALVILKCCQEINWDVHFKTMGTASSPCKLHQWTAYLKNFRGFFLRMILSQTLQGEGDENDVEIHV